MTLTTYDESLCKIVEPNVSTTKERFEALKVFRDHGIPTIVWMTPILPFINDSMDNMQGIPEYCLEAQVKGIITFGIGMTLREGDREYFYEALDRRFPGMKERYIKSFGNAYEIGCPNEKELYRYFFETCRENGLLYRPEDCFAYLREFPEKYEQMSLF